MNQQDVLFSLIYFNNNSLYVSKRLAAHHQKDQPCINSKLYSHALCWLAVVRIRIPLLPANKIKIQRSLILPDVLYGCETWSFTLGKEDRLGVFMNRVLRKIFRPKKEEIRGGESCIMRSFLIYICRQILFVWSNDRGHDGGACGTLGQKRNLYLVFGKETWRKEASWQT